MPKRTDHNQAEIVEALRQIGATVQDLHNVGEGCPDLLVGANGRNYLLEVKNGARARLNSREAQWHQGWSGQVVVVRTVDEALQAIGVEVW